jgi:ABC-2 type transport system permease protein
MKGGTVMLATSAFNVTLDKAIECKPVDSGLEKWLESHGIKIDKTMVLDKQNFPLPIPTRRVVAGYMVEETQLAPFPYFVDVRGDGFKGDDRITAGINQLVLTWSSPISVDKKRNEHRKVVELLCSSPESWTSTETNMDPKYSEQMPLGFPVGKLSGKQLLAAAVEGSFQSYFKGRSSPLTPGASRSGTQAEKPGGDADGSTDKASGASLDGSASEGSDASGDTTKKNKKPVFTNVIDKSPESARIILFASNTFLSDKILLLASESIGSQYLKPIELVQNAADWSLEDRDLLTIRGRGHFSRTLRPMSQAVEIFFEYLNYGLAALGLFVVWLMRRRFWLGMQKRFDRILQSVPKSSNVGEVKS